MFKRERDRHLRSLERDTPRGDPWGLRGDDYFGWYGFEEMTQ